MSLNSFEVNKEASFNKTKRISNLPIVNIPLIRTIITKNKNEIKFEFSNETRKVVDIKINKSETYKLDLAKKILTFEDGKVFNLETLNTLNSRTGRSIDKNEIMSLANDYLNLNIASKNKKEVFIKGIKEKLGIKD
jgi:hypothetical protein